MTLRFLPVLCAIAVFAGCTDDDPFITPTDASTDTSQVGDAGVVDDCIEPGTFLPKNLECSGLYQDWATKTVKPGVREFAPAVALWSDGAGKTRWIQLPAGTKIDNSNPAEWKFPVGTRSWKEFRHNGKRVETRLWIKRLPDWWDKATYAWVDNETRTRPSQGETIKFEDGSDYVIPTRTECDECHKGRTDKLLGFEGPLLGLPGATGVTLATLVQEGLLTNPPAKTTYEMPDDGTGLAKSILPWIHVNCGVSCHNENTNTKANHTGLFMRFHQTELEGKPLSEWSIIKNTVEVDTRLPGFPGWKRIDPGYPESSLLYFLASQRGMVQMPTIATRIVDHNHIPMLKEWIIARGKMEPQQPAPDAGAPTPDAGAPVPVPDAGGPAPVVDAGPVAAPEDAAVVDAEVDAAVPEVDAGAPPAEVDAGAPPVDVDAALPPAEPPPTVPPTTEPPPAELDAAVPVEPDAAVTTPDPTMPPVTTPEVTPPATTEPTTPV